MTDALLRLMVARPEEAARLVDRLHVPVADDTALLDLMSRTCQEAVGLVADVHWAGVTAQFDGPPFTAAHTEDRVLVVDEGQYAQRGGPCLEAIRIGVRVAMTIEQVTGRWPDLGAAAETAGVASFLAVPLHITAHPVGSLNLYSGHPGGLRDPDPDILTVLTEFLERGLSEYFAAHPGRAQVARVRQALHGRALIDAAVGILMAVYGVDAEEGRRRLAAEASALGADLATAAAAVADRYTGDSGGLPRP